MVWEGTTGSAFWGVRTGKAPEALSPDKTGRNRCEGPWDVEEPGNYSRKLQPVPASLCVLGHFAHLLWA